MSSPDPSPATSTTQQKQSEGLANPLAEASRFYRRAYNELFSGVKTEEEPESSTDNTPEYMLFGWHLFLIVRSRSPELFKDLVSCIHGLVAVLAILLIHVPTKFRSFTIEGSSHLIKQTEKGMDLIALLCHNYHASEERLKEMLDKSHKAIEDIFSTKALSASECKTENLDKIDTDGLMYFKGLIDMDCFQSNLEKMEKLCNSNSSEGELDFKSILINNDHIPCAENSPGDSTNLGRSKRVFETLASPTKTIKNMLTVPSSPLSPANGGSAKIVQMTPVTSAMMTAKRLREVISSLPEKPSSRLQQLLSSCDRDLTNAVIERVSIVLEAIFPTKSSANRGGSLGLNCANAFDVEDDSVDHRSPKRLRNESQNAVEHNLQTPPPKQSHMVATSLKAKCHPLQSTFSSPTVSDPVGGNEKCADVTIQIFFSKILKLAAVRIRNLCERLQCAEQTERVYNVFHQILDQQTSLFFNRHVDLIILCCLYGVAKIS